MDTDRDLLFGVMALQKGVVDADGLGETFGAGLNETAAALPDQLVNRGWMTVEQKTELEHALNERLRSHGGNAGETLAATIDLRSFEALKDVPEVGPRLKQKLESAFVPAGPVLIGSLEPGEDESRERYSLTHLYAKGGMGQVWLAHDPNLGREIALKELRPEQVDNTSVCARFLTEAQVTAQLEHPGIVPVYELGKGRQPYYTMRFIKGGTLGQAARVHHKHRAAGKDDPLGMVKLLGAFVGVCHAIAYAHSRGFIHRDLKGQNVVLGDFGEVIVLDWGLAKRIEPDAAARPVPVGSGGDDDDAPQTLDAGDETLHGEHSPRSQRDLGTGHDVTIPGQVLGTPAYMSPEQAEGRQNRMDARTDVYGLGAILYEILTGQAPYHARTTTELLRKVREELPRPPRQVNPAVSPALEAICRKAMSRAPSARYATATELAQDVQRFLADEPVEAYPEPWARRAARWARKHRASAAAAAGLLVITAAGLAVGNVLVTRERNEAQTQRNEARLQGMQARQTVDDMYTKVAESWLEDRLDPTQKEFLEKALDYYRQYTSQASGDPRVQLEHGRMFQRMGDIHAKFGQSQEAERAYGQAVERLEPLHRARPGDPDAARALAVTWSRLGELLFRQERLAAAEPLLLQAETLLKPLADARQPAVEDLWLLARTLRGKADLRRRKGDIAAARGDSLAALELLEKAHALAPKTPEVRCDLATAHDRLGRLHREFGETEASARAFRKAHELSAALVAEYPTIPRYREVLYHACNSLGGLEYETGRWTEAETYWRSEFKEAERLAQDYPDRPDYRHHLAGGCANLGGLLAELGKYLEAEPILRRGIAINTELAAAFPRQAEFRFDLGKCHFNLGYLQFKQGRMKPAITALEEARKTNTALVRDFPDIPRYRQFQVRYLRQLGDAYLAEGRDDGEKTHREALETSEKLAAQHPENALFQIELARCLNTVGALQAGAGRRDEADALYHRALAALETKDVAAWPIQRLREKAYVLNNLGDLQRAPGRQDPEPTFRASVAIATDLASRTPAAREDRQFLSQVQENLAEVLEQKGRHDEANTLLDEAIARLDGLRRESPTSVDDQYYLGYCQAEKGKLLARLKKPAEARRALEQAAAHQREAVRLTERKIPEYRQALADHLEALAAIAADQGAYENAGEAALELAKAGLDPAESHFTAARLLARTAGLIRKDARLDAAERKRLLRSALGNAILMLREAAAGGKPQLAERIEKEPAFQELLVQPEFHAMFDNLVDLGRAGNAAIR